jgi:hypothetical protein
MLGRAAVVPLIDGRLRMLCLRSALCSRPRLRLCSDFALGHVGSSLGRGAPSRCTTATPRRPKGAGGGEDLVSGLGADQAPLVTHTTHTLRLQRMSSGMWATLLLTFAQRDRSWIETRWPTLFGNSYRAVRPAAVRIRSASVIGFELRWVDHWKPGRGASRRILDATSNPA